MVLEPSRADGIVAAEPGRCPGVGDDGRISSLPLPDLSKCDRTAVLDYFDNSWALTETLFAGLQTTEAFYRPPSHNLRHPMIFYYGHPAALYVNKLRVARLLDAPVNDYFEVILETGVDEMSWDDLSKNEMLWPAVADVHSYRATVYRIVRGIIESTRFAPDTRPRTVTMDDPAWALFLAFEHDRDPSGDAAPCSSGSCRRHWSRRTRPGRRRHRTGAPAIREADAGLRAGRRHGPRAGWRGAAGKAGVLPVLRLGQRIRRRERPTSPLRGAGVWPATVSSTGSSRTAATRGQELWSEEGWAWRAFRNAK